MSTINATTPTTAPESTPGCIPGSTPGCIPVSGSTLGCRDGVSESSKGASEGTFGGGGGGGLKRLAIHGSLWTVATQVGGNAMRLAGNLVLTRLLFPDAFGLMVLVGVFTAGLQMFSDFGINQNIIQHERGDDPAFLRTAWTLASIRGVVLWLISCLLAWPYAQWYGEPQLLALLPVISFCAVINGLQSTRLATLNRHLALGTFSMVHLGSQFASLVVTVVWALIYPSVWALVAGGVALSLTRTTLSHVVLKGHRDRFGWDRTAVVAMYGFGKWIFVSTIVFFLARQLDRMLLGKLVSMKVLGVYGIAVVWILLPIELLDRVAHTVLFPIYSKLKVQGRDLTHESRRLRRPLQVLGGVIITLLIIGGQDLIRLLYDDRYLEAGRILQLMAVGAWFAILSTNHGIAVLALGKAKWVAAGHTGKLATMVITGPIGFYWGGIHGLVLGLAIAEVVRLLVLLYGAYRCKLSRGLDDLVFTILGTAICLIAMGLMSGLQQAQINHWLVLTLGVVVSISLWVYPAWSSVQMVLQRQNAETVTTIGVT